MRSILFGFTPCFRWAPERNTGARWGEQGGRGRRWRQIEEKHEEHHRIGLTDGEHLVFPRLWGPDWKGSSGAELRMENREQFLCGVVEGKKGRLKTWPPVRSYDWVCVVLYLPRSGMHHRLTQIWALFICWHAVGEGLRGSGDRCMNLTLEGCGSLYEVMLISQALSGD